MSPEQNIACLFDLGGNVLHVEPHGHGLINDTFVVTTDANRKAILQRINRRVFPRPELISDNLRTLLNHIQSRQTQNPPAGREWKMPVMLRTHEGKDFAVDREGGFWRALSFLEGDSYFKTKWRGQNLHRAMVQFRLTENIEHNERQIKLLIAGPATAAGL